MVATYLAQHVYEFDIDDQSNIDLGDSLMMVSLPGALNGCV